MGLTMTGKKIKDKILLQVLSFMGWIKKGHNTVNCKA